MTKFIHNTPIAKLCALCFALTIGCTQESAVDPAKSSTFIRYFNGAFADEAQALLETPDNGLLILANINFEGIKRATLIKTDEFGIMQWQRFFPAIDQNDPPSYACYGITLMPGGGFAMVGENITTGSLLIITTDADGNTPVVNTVASAPGRKGVSVAVNSAGNLCVVAINPVAASQNIFLSEFAKTNTAGPIWTRSYGAGALTSDDTGLPNKLFVDAANNCYWGGTVLKGSPSNPGMRFMKAPPNEPSVLFDLTMGRPSALEVAGDMIRYGNTFAFIGTNQSATRDTVVVRRMTEGGTQVFSTGYLIDSQQQLTGEVTGNSLAVARDGGLVLLSTVGIGPPGQPSTNFDYCLVKIDGLGSPNPVWTRIIGGRFNERGKNIITARDGGHVVLGTTSLANVNTILLMKVDKDGNIPGF